MPSVATIWRSLSRRGFVVPQPHPPKADAPNKVWAVEFQFDATTDGRPIKIATIVDEHTRECLGGLAERNITGDDLVDALDRNAAKGVTHKNTAARRFARLSKRVGALA